MVGGAISWVGWDPRDDAAAWATTLTEVYRDDGTTWTRVSAPGVQFVEVALPYDDSRVLLAASPSGIWRSADDGETWRVIALGALSIRTLRVSPVESRIAYAAGTAPGLFRSADRGMTWASSGIGLGDGEVLAILPDAIAPRTVLVGVVELNPVTGGWTDRGFIARSTNGGVSFERVFSEPGRVGTLAHCAADPNVVYSGHIYGMGRSLDGGLTWTRLPRPAPGPLAVTVGGPTCDHVLAMVGGYGLYRSDDGAMTWDGPIRDGVLVSPPHGPPGRFHPSGDGRAIAATHRGVHLSTDHGASWTVVAGVGNARVGRVTVSSANPERLLVAGWGDGAWVREPGSSWAPLPAMLDFVYSASETSDGARYVAAGQLQRSVSGEPFVAVAPVGPTFEIVPGVDASERWIATPTRGVMRSTDSGASFTPVNGDMTPWMVSTGTFIDVRRVIATPARVIIGTNGRGVRWSDDVGVTWTQATGVPSLANVSCLERIESAIVACTFSDGLFRSEDDGLTWTPWSEGLGGLEISGVTYDAATGTTYAGSTTGVYARMSDRWEPFDPECTPADLGAPVLATEGGARFLVVPSASEVLLRRMLD